MRLYACVMIFCKWCYVCNMLLECMGSFLQQCLAGENKSLTTAGEYWEAETRTAAGDEESDSSIFAGNDFAGDSLFLFEDTPLGIFDFCSRIEAFKESHRLSFFLL